jgi:hypothetical protein
MFGEYDFKISFIKGKENKVVDSLSRICQAVVLKILIT